MLLVVYIILPKFLVKKLSKNNVTFKLWFKKIMQQIGTWIKTEKKHEQK